jgi:hypothetical protein
MYCSIGLGSDRLLELCADVHAMLRCSNRSRILNRHRRRILDGVSSCIPVHESRYCRSSGDTLSNSQKLLLIPNSS